jgi:hypothetical protein
MTTDLTFEAIRELDELYVKALKSNDPDDWEAYVKSRRIVDAVVQLKRSIEASAPRREGRAA